ncbi:putative reverse transcriptase domain, reverse transcriptase zinc-binding domain protein [Tanacetum coccineum]
MRVKSLITARSRDIKLIHQIALNMIREVTTQEVKQAMFSMGDDKSPGPDGYTVAFFKEAWEIVATDVTNAVRGFFTNGKLLKELNHTIIALISKIQSPLRVNDYRPISCCNVLFKCISKILANRIKHSLEYLDGVIILDALVTVRDGCYGCICDLLMVIQMRHHFHDIEVKLDYLCAFKVDIQKAYDTVDWEFVRRILHGFGFHARMVSWIMECVSTTSYSICINGNLHGYFKGNKGLRQGDPLSPYLFTLIMEVLTLMLHRRVLDSGIFTYHMYCSRLDLINLYFADDLFLFTYGDVHSAGIIKEALDEFKNASGLTPSLPKSTAYFCNVSNHVKSSILSVLPFEEGNLPVKYLGVPLVSSRLKIRDCKELVERVQIRMEDWKNKSLSIAGRLQLIASVIGNVKRGKAKVAWEVVCSQIGDGSQTSLWFDRWCDIGPLCYMISTRDMYRAGLTPLSKVKDIIYNGSWNWPVVLIEKYSFLSTCSVPIVNGSPDAIVCRSNIVVKRKLKMQDRISTWDGSPMIANDVYSIIDYLLPYAERRTSRSVIAKLVVAASTYFIWQERNRRLFKNNKRTSNQVIDCIMSSVRLKLMSCKFKRSRDGETMARKWDLPTSIFEQPLQPALDPATATQEAIYAYYDFVNAQQEVACLMLATKQELLETVKAFHACIQKDGQSMSSDRLKMKIYLDNLERLGYLMSHELGVATTVVLAIKGGKIQKGKNKPQGAKGKSKGKTKLAYALKLKIHPPPKRDNLVKESICHDCKEVGHWRNCPAYQAKLKKKKNTSVASTSRIFTIELYAFPSKSWVYDTGCDTHISVKAIRSFNLIIPSGLVIVLDNFHFAPTITRGVVSIYCLVNNGYIQSFTNYGISVSKDNVFYFNAIPRDGIYEIDMHNLYPNDFSIYNKRIKKLQRDGILQPTHNVSFDKCKSCISGKMACKTFQHQVERVQELLGLIQTDVCGPFRTVSREGANYFITFTDDFSRYGYVYLMILVVKGYALESAARILNMVPTKKVERTPYEVWHGKDPKLSYLGVNKIFVARNAEFFENNLILQEASGSYTLHEASMSDIGLELLQENDTRPSENTSKQHNEVKHMDVNPYSEKVLIRRSKRISQAPNRYGIYVDAEEHELRDLNESPNYKAALPDPKSSKWLDAMNVEMQSMKDNQVWRLVDLPPDG